MKRNATATNLSLFGYESNNHRHRDRKQNGRVGWEEEKSLADAVELEALNRL